MKAIKIIKGLTLIVIGVIFFTIKLYDINEIVQLGEDRVINFLNQYHMQLYFNEFFKQTGINVILSLLFVGVGVMEIIESKGVK